MCKALFDALRQLLPRLPVYLKRDIEARCRKRMQALPEEWQRPPPDNADEEESRARYLTWSKILMESIGEGIRERFEEALIAREAVVRECMAGWLIREGAEDLAEKLDPGCLAAVGDVRRGGELPDFAFGKPEDLKICDCGGPKGHVPKGVFCRKT